MDSKETRQEAIDCAKANVEHYTERLRDIDDQRKDILAKLDHWISIEFLTIRDFGKLEKR